VSKIALTPNASGTGTFTLAAPNSNTSRTITLPDEAGEVLVNTATGINVTGTITSDGLNFDAADGVNITAKESLAITIDSDNNQVSRNFTIYNDGASQVLFRAHDTGDINFFEDTGTTPKFFWDASAESLGIGTGSPSQKLHVEGAGNQFILLNNSTTNDGFYFKAGAGASSIQTNSGSHVMNFFTGGSERMRIDSSGNLLVGATSATGIGNGTNEGVSISSSQKQIVVGVASDVALYLNRQSTDGTIAEFRRDGVAAGSIAVTGSNDLTLYSSTTNHKGIRLGEGYYIPTRNDGAPEDATVDIGMSVYRYKDIYATNGTIQTSDRNEKQDIEALNDAETRVAQACKGLLRKFRWQDAVAEKGDDARIHFGIIAQDLQDAFAAEGLDAGRYAMFISSTWWETQTEVPAVEAVAEVLDDDGNVVTEAVEAKEAYTRTDTYETQEEAPEGATERTRLGVRYPELLAFIIGAM